ncbi:MAG: nitroreductase family protein [Bacteroidales bacterium]|jgi:nitroreductase|nr:nitroreductase family protein [Bacteroidales bacterium]
MIKDLILKNRSYRRFYQDYKISLDELKDMVELARLSASGRNLQPLKYYLSADKETNRKIFSTLAWAGYLQDWDGPEEGERPTGYIIILGDTRLTRNYFCDHGIAAQSMLLGAVEKELGGCIFASIQREKLKQLLNIEEYFEILLVIALGKPKEKVIVEEVKNGEIKYYRDNNQVHHVPKRSLDDIIISS